MSSGTSLGDVVIESTKLCNPAKIGCDCLHRAITMGGPVKVCDWCQAESGEQFLHSLQLLPLHFVQLHPVHAKFCCVEATYPLTDQVAEWTLGFSIPMRSNRILPPSNEQVEFAPIQ